LQSVIKNMTSDNVSTYLGQCNTDGTIAICFCATQGRHGKHSHCHCQGIFLTTHLILKQYLHLQSVVKNMIATATVSLLTLAFLGNATQLVIWLLVIASLKEVMASSATVTLTAFS
jgi:hypothetical protein